LSPDVRLRSEEWPGPAFPPCGLAHRVHSLHWSGLTRRNRRYDENPRAASPGRPQAHAKPLPFWRLLDTDAMFVPPKWSRAEEDSERLQLLSPLSSAGL